MKNDKFSRRWKKWAVAMMLASFSFGAAGVAACKDGKDPEPVQDPLGVFYFDAGIDEYQLALGANNQVTFTANGKSKVGTYTSDGSVVTIKFDGEEGEFTATLDGDVLSWNYNNQQMRFFKKVFYTVSYEEDGGNEVSNTTVVNGKTISKPADPVRNGYEFLGWYVDSEFQTPFMFDTQLVTGNMTLFAQWALVDPSAAAYVVDFDLGYEGGSMPAMETISGKLYNVPNATRDGYKFCGWWISAYENGEKLTYKYTPDTVFTGNTTLFAVWESADLGSKLSAPQAQVTDTGITWDGVSGARIYKLKVTGPDGFLKIDEDVYGTSYAIDFANQPAGDYNVEVTAVASNQANNSVTTTRGYINKAVGRVSQFSVLDGKVLLFNRVENAEVYYITIECGNEAHNHTMYNNGDSIYYNFANCEMTDGGIKFTVTAAADGYAPVVSETFEYNLSLDKVEGLTVDEDTQMVTWYPVKNATNYIVSVSCGNSAHTHEYVDVGSKTSFSLKECSAVANGAIKINVYAQTKGYNSPEPTQYSYNKTKLASPSNITMTNVDKKFVLNWDAVTDYAGGEVTYSIKVGDAVVGTTTSTSIDLTEKLTWVPEESYMIEVKASSATSESVWSDAVKVRYYAMSNKLSYKAGVLSWEPVIGATGYEVRVNDGAVTTVNDGSTSLNIELTNEGTNYVYVRFVDTTANYYSPNWVTYQIDNAVQVVFDGRGSHEDLPTQYKVVGDYLELPTPTREGYDFVGWYNTPKGPESNGAKYESGIFDSTSEMVLYAYWTPAAVQLKYANVNAAGQGVLTQTSGSAVYTKDYKLDVPVVEDKTMVFLGWFAGTSSSAEQLTDDRGYSLKPWALPTGATVYAQYVSNVLEFNLRADEQSYSVVRGVNATKLTSITIPAEYNNKPVTVVDGYAFQQCSRLVTVNIPNTIEIVSEETAFDGCRKLQEVNVYEVEGSNTRTAAYSSVDGVLLYRNNKTGANEISFYPKGKVGAYTIPSTVTDVPLKVFQGTQITEITIPTSVNVIRSNAFFNCATLTKVVFEEGGNQELVIEQGAFSNCTSLKSITLPARLSQLAVNEETHTMDIFSGCTALTHINVERGNAVYASNDGVITDKAGTTLIFCPTARKGSYTIPSTIETIGDYAFVDCKLLTEIVIPGNVEKVGAHAFEGCTKVANIRFAGGAVAGMQTEIGEYAFANLTALKSIEFAEGSVVTKIGAYAFTGASGLRNLTIPTSMQYIGDYAFEKAEVLSEVKFANGNEGSLVFGNYVFSECVGLTKVSLPKSVTTLNLGVFDGCVNISEIDVDDANEYYKDIEGVVFTKDGKTLMFFPKGRKGDANGEYVMPAGVESISEAAFRGMRYIEKIVINNTINYIGKYAFQDSMSLKTLEFVADAENTTAKLIIDEEAFAGCAAITQVLLPNRTQKIMAKAFYGVSMTKVSFPAGLEEIGDYAFSHTALAEVTIPANVASFGEGVFDTCGKLTKVIFANGYQGTTIPYATFQNTAIAEITIPKSIKTIGYAAFNGCKKLTSVAFEEGGAEDLIIGVASADASNAQVIGVFMNCESLTTVNIPARATYIGKAAFNGCSALAKVDIKSGAKLERIDESAFAQCTVLSSFFFPNTLKNSAYVDESTSQEYAIGAMAFANTGLTSVEFEKGGTGDLSIGDGAFANCGASVDTGRFDKETGTPIYEYTYLSKISLPKNLAPIYRRYTNGNSLITETQDGIRDNVFGHVGFTALEEIEVEAGGEYYGSKDGVLYRLKDGVMDTLMLIPYYIKTTSITIPYTVSTIGVAKEGIQAEVVQRCNNSLGLTPTLSSVVFERTPDGMDPIPLNIGGYAFLNVTSLTRFEFPERLVGIYIGAFKNTRLTSVTLPASLEYLDDGGNQFNGVNTMQSLTFAPGIKITEIPKSMFAGCSSANFTTLEIPQYVRKIGDSAFSGCSGITTLKFADKCELTTIESGAFKGLSKITTLALPDNVSTLNGKVFENMSKLEKIILPATFRDFTTIGNGTSTFLFENLSKLSYVEIHKDNPYFKDINGVVYTKDGTELVYYPKYYSKNTNYTFKTPEGVQSIATYAFKGQTKLTQLTISKDLMFIGQEAFQGCTYLTSIVFEARNNATPLSLGDSAFSGCSRLNGKTVNGKNTFTIPEFVKFEGKWAFKGCFKYSNNLYVEFEGENESTALNYTFAECKPQSTSYTGLVGVLNIPSSLSSMTETFLNCTALTTVTFNKDDRGMIATMSGTFKGCKALVSIELPNVGAMTAHSPIVGSYKPTGGYAGTFEDCTALTTVTMKMVNVIGIHAFKNCTGLQSITLPDGLAKIDYGTFMNCTNLRSVTIPGSVETISSYAFYNCTSLQAIEIPSFVSIIGESTFENCSALTNVKLNDGIITISENAFRGVSSATQIALPNTVETIEPYAFYGCSSLTSIYIPASVKTIGTYAFGGCRNVSTITAEEGVETLGDYAFAGFAKVTEFNIPSTVVNLGIGVFDGWTSLKTLTANGNLDFAYKDNVLYNSTYTKIIYVSPSITGEFVVEDTITSLGEGLFAGSGITSVVLPDTITEIPARAFFNCANLASVRMPAALEKIGDRAFAGCTSLKTIDIPKTVHSVFEKEWCEGFNSDGSPNSDENGYYVKEAYDGIGHGAFYGCTALENVVFEAGGAKRLSFGDFAFYGCTSLKGTLNKDGEYEFVIPSRVRGDAIHNDAYTNKGWHSQPASWRSEQGIGMYAFARCSALENVIFEEEGAIVFAEKLLICVGAFYNCRALKSVAFSSTLGNSSVTFNAKGGPCTWTIAAIGENAFYGCGSLEKVTFPKDTSNIYVAASAFADTNVKVDEFAKLIKDGSDIIKNAEGERADSSAARYFPISSTGASYDPENGLFAVDVRPGFEHIS